MKRDNKNLEIIELLKWLSLANLLELYFSMALDNYNRSFLLERNAKWAKKKRFQQNGMLLCSFLNHPGKYLLYLFISGFGNET